MKLKDRIWLLALLGGFLFAYGVMGIPVGIGAFLFVNTILAILAFVMQKSELNKELVKNKETEIVVGIFTFFYILLSFTYVLRMDAMAIAGAAAYHLAFLGMYIVFGIFPAFIQIINPLTAFIHWAGYGINWAISIVKSIGAIFKVDSSRMKFVLKTIVYISASLIVFIVFVTLLSQADPNFKERIVRILDAIKLIEIVFRTFIGVLLLFVLGGLLKLISETPLFTIIGLPKEQIKKKFEKLMTFVHTKESDAFLPLLITVPVLFIFLLFVYLQFKYLFGINVHEILQSFTISQYARKGFAELLVVVALTYPVLGWVTNYSRSKEALPRVLNFVVATAIVACVYVMLYSALTRMGIYTEFYGPSVKRNYVYLAVLMLGIGITGYEVLALVKALYPEKNIIRSFFIGDYTVWAGIVAASLLSAVCLFPWNNYTFRQITEYYSKTGNFDVFQIIDLSNETARDLYVFADALEFQYASKIAEGSCRVDAKCPSIGIKLLKEKGLNAQKNYQNSVNESIFTRVFSLNLSGIFLEQQKMTSRDEYVRSAKDYIQKEVQQVANDFVGALVQNDFQSARKYYDPKMKANNIIGFSPGISLSIDQDMSSSLYQSNGGLDLYGTQLESTYVPKYTSVFYDVTVTRRVSTISNSKLMKTTDASYSKGPISKLEVKVGLRNGKPVIVGSNIVLAYLPDAVASDSSDDSLIKLRDYGYETFCTTPNLENLYNNYGSDIQMGNDCSQYMSLPGDLTKSDFVVETK